jgi:hypothetical protein
LNLRTGLGVACCCNQDYKQHSHLGFLAEKQNLSPQRTQSTQRNLCEKQSAFLRHSAERKMPLQTGGADAGATLFCVEIHE